MDDSETMSEFELWQGVGACVIAAVGFGTLHVPIRRYPTGDGFFVQWAMSVGILLTGFIVNIIEGFPSFQPLAVIGGIVWTVANTVSQKVISGLGLAVALLLWNTTNCITGWATGRFGLFGVKARAPASDALNLAGLGFVLLGGFVIAFVRKTPRITDPLSGHSSYVAPVPSDYSPTPGFYHHGHDGIEPYPQTHHRFHRKSKSLPLILQPDHSKCDDSGKKLNANRILCIILALISGLFYGATLLPIFYIQNHHDDFPYAPTAGLPFVFSTYFGVFIGSSSIFVGYALLRKNNPIVNPKIVLPSMVGGVIWGVSMAGMILSNDRLGQTITYPITTTVPGCVAALWSVFYFKEITTKRNYLYLCVAFALICVGTLLVVLSKLNL
ncbi:unnamed protein product [Bursaphelenchus xylophilus]|uniref:(pine wood nematode) hypothetical protein n=1 Tax=Bursaphelenchus xylophilus TaxID=6326 RepID=A0A1I7SFL6_BURXY|nr:unnamed protein product [Bursaphelenchus xylophilus]CAG9112924.1 unnamed protein product [Bursaphelenchus xylophilus]